MSFQAPIGVICLNAFRVKNISSVRLKIAVGSTPSSLYISKPLHSGTPGTPDPLFPPEDLSSIPAFCLNPLGTARCFSSLLPRSAIWIRRGIQEFLWNSRNRPSTFPEGSKSRGRRETTGNRSTPFRLGITAYASKINATDYRRCCQDRQK